MWKAARRSSRPPVVVLSLASATALADERTAVQQPSGAGYDNPRAGIGPRGDYPPALEDPATVEEDAQAIESEALEEAAPQAQSNKQEEATAGDRDSISSGAATTARGGAASGRGNASRP
jgi:hypothetical protein